MISSVFVVIVVAGLTFVGIKFVLSYPSRQTLPVFTIFHFADSEKIAIKFLFENLKKWWTNHQVEYGAELKTSTVVGINTPKYWVAPELRRKVTKENIPLETPKNLLINLTTGTKIKRNIPRNLHRFYENNFMDKMV